MPRSSRILQRTMRLGVTLLWVGHMGVAEVRAQERESALQPSKAQCIDAHQRTQQHQNAHRLVEARTQAQACVSQACPGPIVADCAQWLDELEQKIPSVVFEVRLDGRHAPNAAVSIDGEPVRDWTRGEALRVNPGEHQFHFELQGYPSVDETLVLAEGMRFRAISADFKTEAAPVPPAKSAPTAPPKPRPLETSVDRPVPFLVYPLLALSGVGLATFTGFAVAGKSSQNDLESTCAPRCTDGDLSQMRQQFLIGDIALGVGVAALVGAGVLYLTRPEANGSVSTSVTVDPVTRSAMALVLRRF